MKRSLRLLSAISLTGTLAAGCGPTPTTPAAQDMATPAPQPKDIVDTALGAGQFTTLVSAVQGAGLEQTLRGAGPFTVFAPTDAAFQKVPPFLLSKLVSPPYKTTLGILLKYHVLPSKVAAADVLDKKQDVDTVAGAKLNVDGSGGNVALSGGATVTTPDVAASNGIIHVIDGVLLPTIADMVAAYKDGAVQFSTLVGAVGAAGLGGTLGSPGPFTVFAPTDAAFAALKASLGSAAYDAILADKAKLTKILTYHVLAGAVYERDVKAGEATTVSTGKIGIAIVNGKVTISDSTNAPANVVFTDVPGRNGVVHIIDKVLIPAGL